MFRTTHTARALTSAVLAAALVAATAAPGQAQATRARYFLPLSRPR
jgi:hypothetical protein